MTQFSIAEAQRQLTDLVERVHEGEVILLLDEGRPVAKLVPVEMEDQAGHLANVQGWLEDDDPFFSSIDEIVEARFQHPSRIAGAAGRQDRSRRSLAT